MSGSRGSPCTITDNILLNRGGVYPNNYCSSRCKADRIAVWPAVWCVVWCGVLYDVMCCVVCCGVLYDVVCCGVPRAPAWHLLTLDHSHT